jgi:hypothetical protein
VPSSQPQAAPVEKGNVFSRVGPHLQNQGSPSSPVLGSSPPDKVMPVGSRADTVPVAHNRVSEGWVSVESRRMARQKTCRNSKGKEVLVAEPVLVVTTGETTPPLISAGEVPHAPSLPVFVAEPHATPLPTEVLVDTPCVPEVQLPSPLLPALPSAQIGDSAPLVPASLLGVPTRSGV